MDRVESLENQIRVLNNRIKALEIEDRRKTGVLDFLMKGLNQANNDVNSLRKKIKSEINRVISKLK